MSDKLMICNNIELPIISRGASPTTLLGGVCKIDYIELNRKIANVIYDIITSNIERLQDMQINGIKIDYNAGCTIKIEFEKILQPRFSN